MKKFLALLLALVMVLSFVACTKEAPAEEVVEEAVEEVQVMSYEEFVAAPLESQVVVETYVQGKQSWWDNKATLYTQSEDGAYFIYQMTCSEEDFALFEEGTKLRINGYKAEWSGEVEIIDAVYEILEGNYVAEAVDVTELLGTEELINYQNQKVSFKGLTVEAVNYKNEEPGDDIYVTLTNGEESFNFCVEVYLTGVDTEVYETVGTLNAGDVVDVEAFLYWYEGANPHITAIALA